MLIGLIILASGIIPLIIFTFFADPAHPYTITETTLVTADGISLQAVIFTPTNKTGCGIVNSHGFSGNKRWNQPLSIELVKHGFTVINLDYRGHGASNGFLDRGLLQLDLMAAIKYLQNLGYINKIGLVGHSMGAGNSLAFAEAHSTLIQVTVSIGNTGLNYNFSKIHNLLMALGKYEETQPESNLITFLRTYTGQQNVAIGVQYGNFTRGNATKAVLGYTEHDLEPCDVIITEETVKWFELAFFGSIQGAITVTTPYLLTSLFITVVGCLVLLFIVMIYLGNLLLKRKQHNYSESAFVKDQSVIKPILYYLIVPLIGFGLLYPLSNLFSTIMPIDMFSAEFSGLVMGNAIGILIVCYLFLSRTEKQRNWNTISSAFRDMTSITPARSLIYGVLVAIISILSLSAILNWSLITDLPTLRETGTIIIIAILFFPFLLLKEFYFRTVQERLKASYRFNSKLREYFSMVGISIFMDVTVLIIPMILTWQTALGRLAFILFPTLIFTCCRHVMLPWVYMHSGRNIIGSAIFYSIFWAWMIIGFYPFSFGNSLPLFA